MADKKKTVNITKLAERRKDYFLLDPKHITIDTDWNERNLEKPEVIKHIEILAMSISKIGIKQPLTVAKRGDQIILTDGFCRMAAVKIAIEKYGAVIKGVPVLVEEKGSNEADFVLSMLTRNEGLSLTFDEQARVIKRLLAFNWSKKEIAEKTGRSLTHIDNAIMILEADGAVMEYLKEGKISARLALDTIKNFQPQNVSQHLKTVLDKAEKTGKKATNRTVNKPANGEKKIAWGKHGPEFMKLLEELSTGLDSDPGLCPQFVLDVVTFYKDYRHDNKITPITELDNKS